MSWTVAIVLSVLGLAGIFLALSSSFDKSRQGMKVFMVMMSLAMVVVLSQICKLIVESKVTGTTYASLLSLTTTMLIVSITIFSFYVAFILIIYTKRLIYNIKQSKKPEEEESWEEL